MARPSVLEETYKSFTENLSGIDFKNTSLYINIEPLPDPDLQVEVENVARKYFGKVVSNKTEEANFTKAVAWCWASADTEFIFHLEDDWILKRKINIKDIMKPFSHYKIKQVPLRAYSYAYEKMCLSPSVMRAEWAKKFDFDYNLNPEVQLRKPWVKPGYIKAIHSNIVVADIGRKWIKSIDYQKPGHKASFTSWEKKN